MRRTRIMTSFFNQAASVHCLLLRCWMVLSWHRGGGNDWIIQVFEDCNMWQCVVKLPCYTNQKRPTDRESFLLRQKRILRFAFLIGRSKICVATSGVVRFSCVAPFGATHFLFLGGRENEKNNRSLFGITDGAFAVGLRRRGPDNTDTRTDAGPYRNTRTYARTHARADARTDA